MYVMKRVKTRLVLYNMTNYTEGGIFENEIDLCSNYYRNNKN